MQIIKASTKEAFIVLNELRYFLWKINVEHANYVLVN